MRWLFECFELKSEFTSKCLWWSIHPSNVGFKSWKYNSNTKHMPHLFLIHYFQLLIIRSDREEVEWPRVRGMKKYRIGASLVLVSNLFNRTYMCRSAICSLPEWESLFVQRDRDQSYTIAFLAWNLSCPHFCTKLLFPVLGIGLSRFLPHTPHDERISAQFCSKRGHELFPDWKNCLRCIFGFIEIVWRMFWNCDNSVFVWCWHHPTCQLTLQQNYQEDILH